MPGFDHIINIPGIKLFDCRRDRTIEVYGEAIARTACPHCSRDRCRIKSTFNRRLKHSKQGNQIVYLNLKAHKYHCSGCRKYFNSRFEGILPSKRSTENFRLEVFQQHQGGIPQSTLARTHHISAATVERWTWDFVGYRIKELEGRSCPKILGIDEHFFTRKQGYATTFADLRNHKVFDVRLGRSESSLAPYLKRLDTKNNVRVAVMDLSETYRSIVKEHFPRALIVADRFHVIRLINHHFLKAWQFFDEQGRKNRGLLSLMRRHAWNLRDDQVVKLNKYLKSYPVLHAIYEFKNELVDFLLQKALDKWALKKQIPKFLEMVQQLTETPIASLKQLGETIRSWQVEILRMLRFRKTNSITEGLHNKMEMISRRACGFRNFENYRLRVIALCGWDGVINRVR